MATVKNKKEPAVCEWAMDVWTKDYDTGCGLLWTVGGYGPEADDKDSTFKFCPFCGKPITVKE